MLTKHFRSELFDDRNELNVAQKETHIDEWLILLKNIILLMKSQLVTSYTLKHDVNRCF
jgi:hypothetical protein